jgi:hypothetical protein
MNNDNPIRLVIARISLICLLLAVSVCMLGCPVSNGHAMQRINNEIKSNLRAVQLGIERYASDYDGIYPEDVSDVIAEGYMDAWPTTRDADGADMTMGPIEFVSAPNHGMFVYLPVVTDDVVTGYYLMAYGTAIEDGMDVDGDGTNDHIIEVLEGSWSEDPLPPLAEMLGE